MNRNKKTASKETITRQLDTIVDNITKRGVYVVKKQPHGFSVHEYLTDNIVVGDIPDKIVAQRLCDRFNQGNRLTTDQIKKLHILTSQYRKNKTDLMFFENTIRNTKDVVKLDTTVFRYEKTGGALHRIIQQLERF
jgi:hypothetical protein